MPAHPTTQRFQALDLLRGFFIVVIICDHLGRWPSIFGILSGKALLWVTAAEGFVIISGLLLGYIRGFKSKDLPFRVVTITLWRRSLTLYAWAIIATIAYTAIVWYVPLAGGTPGVDVERGDWLSLLFNSLSLNYTFVWVYFLKLYALFIAAAPLAIWLLRKGHTWALVGVSLAMLCLGWLWNNEALQWQFIFFMPVVAGYYMVSIKAWWRNMPNRARTTLELSVIGLTILTIALSYIGTFHPELSAGLANITLDLFAKDSISLFRALVAFTWFTGYLLLFIRFQNSIKRWFGWLLLPIGTRSLTAYIMHGAAIIIISVIFSSSENFVVNSLLGATAIILTWAMVKIPHINRVVPR
jgi:hypothetical protein